MWTRCVRYKLTGLIHSQKRRMMWYRVGIMLSLEREGGEGRRSMTRVE